MNTIRLNERWYGKAKLIFKIFVHKPKITSAETDKQYATTLTDCLHELLSNIWLIYDIKM